MNETLRPSTLGEILDRTFQLYRRSFWLFFGTAALPFMFIFALAIPVGALIAIPGITARSHWENAPLMVVAIVLFCLAAIPIYLAAYVFSYAGITQATVSLFRGEKPTFRGTLASVKPRFWTYLWYMLLQGITAGIFPTLVACAFIVPLVYLISRPGMDLSARFALGFLVGLVAVTAIGVMIWLFLSFTMGMAACVAEKKTAWASLVRSWRLSTGTRGRIFVTYLLVMALAVAISMALSIPMLILIFLFPSSGPGVAGMPAAFVAAEIVRAIANFASQVLLMPISLIAAVLFYFDQRIRKEGYDIEWMMQKAGLAQPPSAAPLVDVSGGFPPVTPPDNVEKR